MRRFILDHITKGAPIQTDGSPRVLPKYVTCMEE